MAKSLDGFYQVVLMDKALQDEIAGAGSREKMIESAVKIGVARGFSFTADEVTAKLDSLEQVTGSGELSDTQLASVAGGAASYGSSTLCTYCGDANGGRTYNAAPKSIQR